ncbi:hypothetical protein C2S51_036832 [Perilla frutescens var. frutescens]|nr:hypothetical protein C2S51_036832 [Perilla frutescens var. frutescens]
MNMMSGWLEHPTMENLRQESAIRQFCAARVEEQGECRDDEEEFMEIWSSLDFSSHPSHADDQLVDTFLNETESNEDDDQLFQQADDDHHHTPRKNVVDEGLELVHLLLGCAEAVGCRDAHMAQTILSEIWARVSPWGDSVQRVSQWFAMGLNSRLNVNPNGSLVTTREEKSEAFNLLHQTTPLIAFGLMAANSAICEAAREKECLHIIDLGMDHNLQWPSIIHTLSSRPQAPPQTIRFTAFIGDHDTRELENSMRKLCEEGAALGISSMEYNLVREQVSPSTLSREKLGLRKGEAVFVNSIMQLHKHVKESRGSLKTILQAIKKLSPALVTVVEQDANHNGPFFLGRFLESLHYYSAIFDSLDATLPRNSPERMKIEKAHLAEEIHNVVAYEGSDRVERHERADQWRRQLGRAGFQVVGINCLSEAKMLVCGYGCDGYTVATEKGCLQLGWKGRPIMLASAWHLNKLQTPPS